MRRSIRGSHMLARGMGQIDVAGLAQMCAGGFNPTFTPESYMSNLTGQMTEIGAASFVDGGSAGAIASALGNGVQAVQQTYHDSTVDGTDIPEAWYLLFPDGTTVNAASVASQCQAGSAIAGGEDYTAAGLCQLEALLSSMIPDSAVDASCSSTPVYGDIQSYSNAQTSQGGTIATSSTYTPTYTSGGTVTPPSEVSKTVTPTPIGPPAPPLHPSTTGTTTTSSAASPPATSSTSSNGSNIAVGPVFNHPIGSSTSTTGTSTNTAASSSSTNWLTETSIDSIPNWAWVAGGAALLLFGMMAMGGRR